MAESSKFKVQSSKFRNQLTWFLFLLAVILLYLFALDLPLLGPDEPRYSQVAREMYERGDWVTTTLGGYDWFEKPALLYWLQITFYNLFGVSEFSARLGSALFGLGTIFSLWLLGKSVRSPQSTLYNLSAETQNETHKSKIEDQKSKTDFANWLALIAASSLGLLVFSRGASFDIILTFPITSALVSFFLAHQNENKSDSIFSLYLLPFYFFIGVAMIAKGLVGIIFPFAIVAFYYVLLRKFPSRIFILSLFWGTIISLLVASTWYLPMYLTNGWKFIDEFFIQHHFQRYSSNKYLHPQPFWFFWVVLPLMTIPWIPFFLAGVWKFVKSQISNFKTLENKQSYYSKSKLQTFAFAWMLVPLVFFSLSGSKLPGYILPALPAAIIIAAIYIYEFIQKSVKRKILIQFLAFLTFAVIAFLLEFVVMTAAPHESVKGLIETANQNNYSNTKILSYKTITHNVEFYGANRLIRMPDGKQKRFDTLQELENFIRGEDKTVLVIASVKDINELNSGSFLSVKILGDNTKLALAAVSPR